jgi:hypothetical protein
MKSKIRNEIYEIPVIEVKNANNRIYYLIVEQETAFDNSPMGKDRQTEHMKNYYYHSDDNHGVHINSGIPNKAFI